MEVRKSIMNARVLIGMLVVQVIATGLQLLSRVILTQGTFLFALLAYRNVVGAICVLPFALYWERDGLKKVTWIVFFWLFMVALTGITMAMGLFYLGLTDTTATYATNFLNLIPVVTFIFSSILRMNTKAGKVKTLGAVICLAGALTIALYKGKAFHCHNFGQQNTVIKTVQEKKTRGTLLLVGSILSYGMWFTAQVKLVKVFPYKFCATMFTCVIASIQLMIIGLCINRKPEAWKLGWNLQLITIVYSGTLATAATFCLISWAIAERGPTYPSMFNPLSLILVAILEAIFLGEPITVGSLLGMCLIIVGLYSFLWGKSKEPKAKSAGMAKEGGPAVPEAVGLESVTVVMPANTKISNVEDDNQIELAR
ncbi:WAT1-related At5g64700-like [Olea europaea subsp. europaea]|uniref:WAT1-related protein n=1 Tax=Olea europaea subsp. europaea TaxID=158383 RepID=A0A8S0QY25_OLEEU|nr:WAT1-related At5g64700-like [Olea europaea subsp. europaea]